jgi:hypothetical protein
MSFYKEYIKEPFRLFLNIFKNKKLGLILLVDIIFYIVFYLGFKVFIYYATNIMQSLEDLNLGVLQNLNSVELESANQLLAQLQSFIMSIFGAVFLFALFIIITLTIIKGWEWSKIVNKKNKLFDYKLLILNIIWFIVWIVILIIPFAFIPKEVYLTRIPYFAPFILYFTLFLYMNYVETKKIGKALIAPIKQGLLKFHRYVTPLIIITLFIGIPFAILKLINIQNETIHLILFLIISVIALAAYKLYFYTIKKEH